MIKQHISFKSSLFDGEIYDTDEGNNVKGLVIGIHPKTPTSKEGFIEYMKQMIFTYMESEDDKATY